MASIYTRVYTYTGQGNVHNLAMRVAWNQFQVSGDTTHRITQILSVTYEHTHSSTLNNSWALAGRLVFGDGSSIDSDVVRHKFSGSAFAYLNTFSELPSAEQWNGLQYVDTTYNGSNAPASAGGSNLYWRATAASPMRIVVTFYAEPPVKYAPAIERFTVCRVNAGGAETDEGTYIAAGVKLSLAAGAPVSEARLTLYRGASREITESTPSVDLTNRIPQLLSGVSMDTSLITGQFEAGKTWYFTLVFSIGEERAESVALVYRAIAPLHITNEGCAFGGLSTATPENRKNEFYDPVYFYGGIGGGALAQLGVQTGSAAAQSVAASGTALVNVSFPKPYAQAPTVIANITSDSTSYYLGRCNVAIQSVTGAGFTARIANGGSAAVVFGFNWAALGALS